VFFQSDVSECRGPDAERTVRVKEKDIKSCCRPFKRRLEYFLILQLSAVFALAPFTA